MGVAQVLAGLRAQLRGSVKFIFQPAEEMPPEGEDGGAKMMIAEGALENPTPQGDLRPARHLAPAGRRDRLPAGADDGQLRQAARSPSQAARPTARRRGWASTPSSPRRRSCWACRPWSAAPSTSPRAGGGDHRHDPGGVRENIIPDSVEMRGTIRTFDEAMRDDIHERVTTLAEVGQPRLARRLHRSASARTTRSRSTTPR